MKEIKYYISDDESRQSKSQEEIEAFEAKHGTDFETKVSEILKKAIIGNFVDDNRDIIFLIKIDKTTDVNSLFPYFVSDIDGNYNGCAVIKHVDPKKYISCCWGLFTIDSYLNELQNKISTNQAIISKINEICNKR